MNEVFIVMRAESIKPGGIENVCIEEIFKSEEAAAKLIDHLKEETRKNSEPKLVFESWEKGRRYSYHMKLSDLNNYSCVDYYLRKYELAD